MKLEGRVLPTSSENTGPVTVKQLFMDPELRKPLFIACALAVIQQFSGINAVRVSFTAHLNSIVSGLVYQYK